MALSDYKGPKPGGLIARTLAGQTVLPEGAYLLVEGQLSPFDHALRETLARHPAPVITSVAGLRQHLRTEFAEVDPVEQAVTDQTALQSEARHAARLEDERAEDELTGDQSADALGRALQGIRDAHRDVWPF